jgi:gliding motility-associated protein GldC
MKTSDIKFSVTLNENKFPTSIKWSADDSGVAGNKDCSSVLISVWDPAEKCTLRIDLWTDKMMVEEMQHLFYETLRSMADTYKRATNDDKAADELRQSAMRFGKMIGVVK